MAHIRVFKHYFHVPFIMLGMLEGLILCTSIYVGANIRFHDRPDILEDLGPLLPRGIVFALVMLVSMVSMGVYQARLKEGASGVLLRTGVSFLLGAAALSLIFYAFPDLYMGRGIIAMAATMSFICVWFLRMLFSGFVDDSLLKRRVLVLGAGKKAKNIIDRLTSSLDTRGFVICGFVPMATDATVEVEQQKLVTIDGDILSKAEELNVDEIVVAMDERRNVFPMDALLDCKLAGIDVVDVVAFFERETGKLEVDLLNPGWMVFSDGFQRSALNSMSERFFDIVSSSLLLLFTWPIMVLASLAILIEDGRGASVLYKQTRVGFGGRSFSVFKFRSMSEDAEKHGVQWAKQNDPRVTRVGAFIRKYRIDELPQILNVLRGDMSFVGPRPERPQFVEDLKGKIKYYDERHRVKPGITGWAQLNYPYGASDEDALKKLQYDLYYVKNHSLLLDLLILIQTVEVILFGKGAR